MPEINLHYLPSVFLSPGSSPVGGAIPPSAPSHKKVEGESGRQSFGLTNELILPPNISRQRRAPVAVTPAAPAANPIQQTAVAETNPLRGARGGASSASPRRLSHASMSPPTPPTCPSLPCPPRPGCRFPLPAQLLSECASSLCVSSLCFFFFFCWQTVRPPALLSLIIPVARL